MKKRLLLLFFAALMLPFALPAQKVTVHANGQPAAAVFREIMEQTGKNFVYPSELLKDLTITVDADNRPLKNVLSAMFDGTGISYKIKGKNVVLKRKVKTIAAPAVYVARPDTSVYRPASGENKLLSEVVVVSRLESPAVETSEIGAKKVTLDEVRRMPALFGENDIIKTLHAQPGVSEGTEGLAGMYVHGGNADENQYMLDNVPLYQVNHFAGLFSAFNPEIIRYVDFFKSSIPAKYDGRLSSFMDVRLQNGIPDKLNGTARLGLTSGAFNISGPIGRNTSYLVGLRRSWYDVLTIPMLAIINSKTDDEKIRFQYYFMDLNARINHRFSDNLSAFVSAYYGNDLLRTGDEYKDLPDAEYHSYENDRYDFDWGNMVVQAGINCRLSPTMTSEFTAAYTRFQSKLKRDEFIREGINESLTESHTKLTSENNINDWIFKGDFDWQPDDDSRIRFGAGYTRHSFLPGRTTRDNRFNDNHVVAHDSVAVSRANELNLYIEDDWRISESFRVNAGLHYSLFDIDKKLRNNLSPRISLAWRADERVAVKAAYSRTVQYVHQIAQSSLALPTDQWIPVTGKFKPQTADKISCGVYGQTEDGDYAASVEGYWKWMHHLIEYRDEYYLRLPLEPWDSRLTAGRGRAKGIDFKIEKRTGKLTGHIAYSLAWSDRTFAEKNGGVTYPARFDNRHTVNIVANWEVSKRVQLNAAWVGHSGNRFTFMPQLWAPADFGRLDFNFGTDAPLRCPVNNYQLPFYHRLDLSCMVRNKRGYWTFSIYNAYCHMNTIAIRYGYRDVVEHNAYGSYITSKPVYQKVKILPIIPSISYTWQF